MRKFNPAAPACQPVSNVSHMKVHAAGKRTVSVAELAPTSGEIVTQIQSGSSSRIRGSNPTWPATQSVCASAIEAHHRPISPIVVWGPRLRTHTMRPSSMLTYPDTTPKLRLVRVSKRFGVLELQPVWRGAR